MSSPRPPRRPRPRPHRALRAKSFVYKGIRNLDDTLHARLKVRAAAAGRSMEEEARLVLRDSLDGAPDETLWSAMRAIFAPLGGVELDLERQPGQRPPPDFSGRSGTPPRSGIRQPRKSPDPVILLETNVISELARPAPHQAVARRAQSMPAARFRTASVCEAEILAGIALMPAGRRRDEIAEAMRAALRTMISGRVLAFDRAAAAAYAEIAARRHRAGQPIGTFDQLIAAVAVGRQLEALATRNTPHFEGCGVPLIDPWQTP